MAGPYCEHCGQADVGVNEPRVGRHRYDEDPAGSAWPDQTAPTQVRSRRDEQAFGDRTARPARRWPDDRFFRGMMIFLVCAGCISAILIVYLTLGTRVRPQSALDAPAAEVVPEAMWSDPPAPVTPSARPAVTGTPTASPSRATATDNSPSAHPASSSPSPGLTPGSPTPPSPAPLVTVHYDAESPQNRLTTGASPSAQIVSCTLCAGGRKIRYVGGGNTVSFTGITAAQAGPATVRIMFLNGDAAPRSAGLTVNDGATHAVTFAPTGGWQTPGAVTVVVELQAGQNVLTFANPSGWTADLDGIDVTTGG
ncbi:hypothetical protein GCM10009662_61970 [Catellatospora coxensis]|uniref:CBM6 domain-containing protein n=1 Tax=Catellatospora coxensis TaxID=310354 RepID=A0A8J3KQF3_9ACTN|nr:hypothetical protein Cco03nite_38970 [Catellatospora coxensis]